jgi:hypothetical protein
MKQTTFRPLGHLWVGCLVGLALVFVTQSAPRVQADEEHQHRCQMWPPISRNGVYGWPDPALPWILCAGGYSTNGPYLKWLVAGQRLNVPNDHLGSRDLKWILTTRLDSRGPDYYGYAIVKTDTDICSWQEGVDPWGNPATQYCPIGTGGLPGGVEQLLEAHSWSDGGAGGQFSDAFRMAVNYTPPIMEGEVTITAVIVTFRFARNTPAAVHTYHPHTTILPWPRPTRIGYTCPGPPTPRSRY